MAEQPTSHRDPDHEGIYPENAAKATPALESLLKDQMQNHGPLPFSTFMDAALYHPQHGYYSSDRQITGKQGDFITSVSVGPCFGIILARRLHAYWQSIGEPTAFSIIESGAHDGSLAKDILNAASDASNAFYASIHYHLIERSDELKEFQSNRLHLSHPEKFTTHTSLTSVSVAQGAVISNELIDAFPVELIRFNGDSWEMLFVEVGKGGTFVFCSNPVEVPSLAVFCSELGNQFPEGYTTEYNTGIQDYTRDAANAIESGLFLTIDYGHTHEDYYHPDRLTGTLQTYRNHQKADNPLNSPGECDITAHVDFSRLQKSATQAGFRNPHFVTQSSYLTEHARSWLLAMESQPQPVDPALIKQFHTLTHPSMLGTRFHVLELEK